MILADKIIELRKKNGWSQEELAEKMDVSRQSISKWEGAQSVPDMARILRLSELFGVSTDYLLKEEMGMPDTEPQQETGSDARPVSMEEATAFLQMKAKNARTVALGVLLCIFSPILLILLGGASEFGKISLSDMQVGGIGLIALFVLIAGGVALFVISGLRASKYEYLEKEPIDILYGVEGMVRERREAFRPVFNRQLTIGIVLCVLSMIPLGVSLLIANEEENFLHVASIALMLVMIGVGVLLIVHASMIWGGYQRLLEEGDYSRENKEDQKAFATFDTIYWLAATAVYLAWSFLSNDWHRTWIVWPIAGVAYGIIFGVAKALRKKNG